MCCGWRKLDFLKEERKLWMYKLTNKKMIRLRPYNKPPSFDHTTGGEYALKLWLTDKEVNEFEVEVDKEYLNIISKRSQYASEEAILHMIYIKYPELFEDE